MKHERESLQMGGPQTPFSISLQFPSSYERFRGQFWPRWKSLRQYSQKSLCFSDKKGLLCTHIFLCLFALTQLLPAQYMNVMTGSAAASLQPRSSKNQEMPMSQNDGLESWSEPGSQMADPPPDFVLCMKDNPYLFVPPQLNFLLLIAGYYFSIRYKEL